MFKFKKKKNYLLQSYKRDPISKAFIIEVSLDSYNDVFNEWDPAPFRRRDIDPDFLSFLEENAIDIPIKQGLKIYFYLPKDTQNLEKEKLTITGIRNNFRYAIQQVRNDLNMNRKRILLYLLTGIVFLSLAVFLEARIHMMFFRNTITEGLFIGGWVFIWEAFSLFFFKSQVLYANYKKYSRFLETEIIFKYMD